MADEPAGLCRYGQRASKGRPARPMGLGALVPYASRARIKHQPHFEGLWQTSPMVHTREFDDAKGPFDPLCGPEDVVNMLSFMRHRPTEQAIAVLVDEESRPVGIVPLGEGVSNMTTNSMANLGRAVLATGAAGVIHVHNHPNLPVRSSRSLLDSGDTLGIRRPSLPDRATWKTMYNHLPVLGASLVDGLVIGEGGSYASWDEEQDNTARNMPAGRLLDRDQLIMWGIMEHIGQ